MIWPLPCDESVPFECNQHASWLIKRSGLKHVTLFQHNNGRRLPTEGHRGEKLSVTVSDGGYGDFQVLEDQVEVIRKPLVIGLTATSLMIGLVEARYIGCGSLSKKIHGQLQPGFLQPITAVHSWCLSRQPLSFWTISDEPSISSEPYLYAILWLDSPLNTVLIQ